jgi:regulator of replication initiation timing
MSIDIQPRMTGHKKKSKQQYDQPKQQPVMQQQTDIQIPTHPQQVQIIQSLAIQPTNMTINIPMLMEENKSLRDENMRLRNELGIKTALLQSKIEEINKRDKQIEELIAQNEQLRKENTELKIKVEKLQTDVDALYFQLIYDKLINAIQDANRIFSLEKIISSEYSVKLCELRNDRNMVHYIDDRDNDKIRDHKIRKLIQVLRDEHFHLHIDELNANYCDNFSNVILHALEKQLCDKPFVELSKQENTRIERYWLKRI